MSLESAESLLQKGNQAFVDEEYVQAKDFFTQSLQLDHTSVALLNRAAASLMLEEYAEVIADCDEALKANTKSPQALLRKGIALFGQENLKAALEVFEKGKSSFPSHHAFKTWAQKAQAELADSSKKVPAVESKKVAEEPKPAPAKAPASEPAKAAEAKQPPQSTPAPSSSAPVSTPVPTQVHPQTSSQPPKPAIKHEWFQSDTYMVVTIFIKNLKKDDVNIQFAKNSLSVTIKLPTGADYSLEMDLAQEIDVEGSLYNILGTKVEIKLKKTIMGLKWATLEAEAPKPTEEAKPHYPSSSKKTQNWDALEKKVVKDEEDEKEEGDAALNKLFRQIYANGSEEQKRAMMKSFVESGGTKLSTNWEDVGKETQQVQPPSGMEAKKYEY